MSYTPSKYTPMLVAQAMLEEAVELHPRCPTAQEFLRRIVADPGDRREVEVAIQAIRTLEQAGLFCTADEDQRVVPTEAALLAFALLTR
jgi:hypothetical protein